MSTSRIALYPEQTVSPRWSDGLASASGAGQRGETRRAGYPSILEVDMGHLGETRLAGYPTIREVGMGHLGETLCALYPTILEVDMSL